MNGDLEGAIISAILLGEPSLDEIRECVENERLLPEYFTDSNARAIFQFFLENPGLEGEEFRYKAREVASCGVLEYFIDKRATPEYVAVYIRNFAEESRRDRFSYVVDTLKNAVKNGSMTIEDFTIKVAAEGERYSSANQDHSKLDGKAPSELGQQIPEEEDPDALFRNGWLQKGGAAVLVAQTGVGKSVIAFQMAYAWACGVAAFGIEPIRPLRIAIIHSEDDDNEQRKFRDSMMRGYREFHGWTDADFDVVDANIKLFYIYDKQGDEFVDWLRSVQRRHKFDLLIINPLQGFVNFDLNDNKSLRAFLNGSDKSLDTVIKNKNAKCGLLIIHHTNKPMENNKHNSGTPSAYIGAGGASLSNWMRASLTLVKDENTGTFYLSAPKRGKKLSWPNDRGPKLAQMPNIPGEPEFMFWREVDGVPKTTRRTADPKQNPEDDIDRVAESLRQREEGWSMTEARKHAQMLLGKPRGNAAYDAISKDPEKFGFSVVDTGKYNKKILKPRKTA